ncbi:MAG TPA: DUF4124 domain-containing protein [Usitatibacter sp.]|nr:DUF4124 domain-containing protein [Usitatibacter sp.]
MDEFLIRRLALSALVVACALAGAAGAETIYKLIDKSGKVTYVEKPPSAFDGQVIRIDIDPNANTATSPKASAPPSKAARELDTWHKREMQSEARLQQAKDKLDSAKKALADARDNPGEGDIQRRGNVGGGTRPVFSDSYQQRLQSLEQAVTQAEEELRRIERGS